MHSLPSWMGAYLEYDWLSGLGQRLSRWALKRRCYVKFEDLTALLLK